MASVRQRFAALIRPGLSTLLAPIDKVITQRTHVRPLLELLDRSRDPIAEFFRDCLDSTIAARPLTVKVLISALPGIISKPGPPPFLSRPYGLVVDPQGREPRL
jgi:hypothetical protein